MKTWELRGVEKFIPLEIGEGTILLPSSTESVAGKFMASIGAGGVEDNKTAAEMPTSSEGP